MEAVKRLSGALGTVALWALAASVGAQELSVDQTKLYVTDPAACQMLADKGVDAFGELDFLSMSFADGIQGMEFNCNFFDVKSKKGNRFLFVNAVCEAPGEVYPDTISISPYDETSIQIVSTYDSMLAMSSSSSGEDGGPTGATIYHRCDNLSELPR
jgi:hypothetical protein